MNELVDHSLDYGKIAGGILAGAMLGGNAYFIEKHPRVKKELGNRDVAKYALLGSNVGEISADLITGGSYDYEFVLAATISALATYNAMEYADNKINIFESSKWDELKEELDGDIEDYK